MPELRFPSVLLLTADIRHAKVNFRHVVPHTDRLGCNGQRWVNGCRGREEGGVHNEKVIVVKGSAEFV